MPKAAQNSQCFMLKQSRNRVEIYMKSTIFLSKETIICN